MSDIIHLLPDSVANQIAAGEVIQRPASVVKELVENALDAGANHVDVLITDAGRTCIQVIDDGKGMSDTDARLSFERHATSKIRAAADLYSLHTMGFRGEALASIAAVAQVELKTKQQEAELGSLLTIEGSQVVGQEPVMCANGSNFSVKNLFFNVPARRKFLKSNSTELSNILTEFERIVLVNPTKSFTFHHNGVELQNLQVCPLRQRLMDVFGKKMNQQLLSVEVDTTLVKMKGYITKPEDARKKNAHQYFFVNNRYMRHPYFHRAVMDAYEQLVPTGYQISYFLYFDVEPANIDVNIHPTKTEIKFENEQAIWQIISAAVKETLGKFNAVPTIDFDNVDKPEIPVFEAVHTSSMPEVHYNPSFNPFAESDVEADCHRESSYKKSKISGWDTLCGGAFASSKINRDEPVTPNNEALTLFNDGEEHQDETLSVAPSLEKTKFSSTYIQYKGRFILTSVKSGLMVIEQHRAHIRILYDRYHRDMVQKKANTQRLLFPEVIQFSPSETAVLDASLDEFASIGFELDSLGGGNYSINGVPAGIEKANPTELVRNMLATLMQGGANASDEMYHKMALSLAQIASIPAGQLLTQEEMGDLVGKLLSTASPNYTPDGKKIIKILTEEEFEKWF